MNIDTIILNWLQQISDNIYHKFNIGVPIILQLMIGVFLITKFIIATINNNVPFMSMFLIIMLIIVLVILVGGIYVYGVSNLNNSSTRNPLEVSMLNDRMFMLILTGGWLVYTLFRYDNRYLIITESISNINLTLFWYLVSTTKPKDPPKCTIKNSVFV